MDYTNEIFSRLQNGESVEDIAATLTKNLNDANEQYKAAEAAKKAEAEAKAQQDNLFNQKVDIVDALLAEATDLLVLYDVDEEIIDVLEHTDPEEVVEALDQAIPFFAKYFELNQELENLKSKKCACADKVVPAPKKDVPVIDPIEEFLNQLVRH